MCDRTKSLKASCIAAALLLPLSLGCQVEDMFPEEEAASVAKTRQSIICENTDGNCLTAAGTWPFVPLLSLGGGLCTGTLVRPEIVLTAAHCVEGVSRGTAHFNPDFPQLNPESIEIVDIATHRAYAGFAEKDVALLRLASAPVNIEPVAFNLEPLDDSWINRPITTVGYGNNVAPVGGDPNTGTGAGTQRFIDYSIDGVTAEHLLVGDTTKNTCQGDSGGPTFFDPEGAEPPYVLAVTSFGTFNCQGQSNVTRTDVYQNDFLLETIAAWDGPCSADGVCNDSGECQFIDPDCDVCGFDGICGADCENVDLDCPLGGLSGDTCEDKFDCESRVCVTAPDDPRVKFCSAECDPAMNAIEQCDVPLSACAAVDDGNYCIYNGPTAGTQGAACTSSDECLDFCDTDNAICVTPCGDDSDCSEEYACVSIGGTKVCTLSEDSGCGCRTGGSPANLATFGLALLGLLLLRRRRN